MDISPALRAFLDLIAWSEGTATSPVTQDDGYDVIVSGIDGPHRMTDYDDHPFAPQYNRPLIQFKETPPQYSTASGRYQLLYRYWKVYRVQLGLTDYGHAAQDAVALQQIKERGAIGLIENGDIAGAIKACANIWASLPGNSYGQGGHSMDALLGQYQKLIPNSIPDATGNSV